MTDHLLALSDWPDGLFTFLLGIVVVFLGMLIIVFFVSLVGKVINRPVNNKKEETIAVTPVKQSAPAPVTVEGEVPEDVKVAIIAAIAMYYENNNQPQPKHEFAVKKIKKLRN